MCSVHLLAQVPWAAAREEARMDGVRVVRGELAEGLADVDWCVAVAIGLPQLLHIIDETRGFVGHL